MSSLLQCSDAELEAILAAHCLLDGCLALVTQNVVPQVELRTKTGAHGQSLVVIGMGWGMCEPWARVRGLDSGPTSASR